MKSLQYPALCRYLREEPEIDLMAVCAERLKLTAELAELNARMDNYLKELGYL